MIKVTRRVPEYRSWSGMRQRCNNKSLHAYHRYGGRGIKVCERWNIFETFLADMGPKPSPIHSIDRIDNDGNYEPANCRWATPREQRLNAPMVLLTHKGYTMSVSAWAERIGFAPSTIRSRLKMGWSIDDALEQLPLSAKRVKPKG